MLPPLRARTGDAQLLALQFVARLCAKYNMPRKQFDLQTLAWIDAYSWPGNVRELENWVHRELLMTDGQTIRATPAPLNETETSLAAVSSFRHAKAQALRAFERGYALVVMRQAGGNVTQAARLAGQERRAFGKLIKKHGIDPQHLSD